MVTASPGRTTLIRLAGTPHFVHRFAHPCGPMKGTSGAQFFRTAAAKKGSMWSWWMWVASTASTCVTANGSSTMGAARRFGCVARPPVMFRIWWNGAISLVFWVRFPLPNHRSVAMFAPLWVLSQMPVQPIHHMLNVPGATSVASISSLSQVPHSGKAPRIHFSRVMSSIMLMVGSLFLRVRGWRVFRWSRATRLWFPWRTGT